MTLTMAVEMPDSFSPELKSMLVGLLQRDVSKRLGCRGQGANELKNHPFFRGIDWRVVYLQRLPPPLIPARGEVNAADAFDIGSFDEEDTKHINLTEADQELYRNFPVVVSERWQHEIAETIFDYINHEADKAEMKRKNKNKLGYQEEEWSDCILHGYVKRLGGTFTATWLTRYLRLYPNRLELYSDGGKPELIFMDQIEEVCNDYVQIKNEQCIVIKMYNHSKYVFTNSDEIGLKEWLVSLKAAHKESLDMLTTMAEKATKIYGAEIPLKHLGKRRQQLQLEANSAVTNLEQKLIQEQLTSSQQKKQQQQQQQQQQAGFRGAGLIQSHNQGASIGGSPSTSISTGSSEQQSNNTNSKIIIAAGAGCAGATTHGITQSASTSSASFTPSGGSSATASGSAPHKHHRHQHRSHHHRSHHHSSSSAGATVAAASSATGTGSNQASGGTVPHHSKAMPASSLLSSQQQVDASTTDTGNYSNYHIDRVSTSTSRSSGHRHHHRSSTKHQQHTTVNTSTGTNINNQAGNIAQQQQQQQLQHQHSLQQQQLTRQQQQQQQQSQSINAGQLDSDDVQPAADLHLKKRYNLVTTEDNNKIIDNVSGNTTTTGQTNKVSREPLKRATTCQEATTATCSDKQQQKQNSLDGLESDRSSRLVTASNLASQDDELQQVPAEGQAITTGTDRKTAARAKLDHSSSSSSSCCSSTTGSTVSEVLATDAATTGRSPQVIVVSASVSSDVCPTTTTATGAAVAVALSSSSKQQTELSRGDIINELGQTIVDVEQQQQQIKLAVSLENLAQVSQQEVMIDPSKRITSNNYQREQDLVTQYEKLNISAHKSPSTEEITKDE